MTTFVGPRRHCQVCGPKGPAATLLPDYSVPEWNVVACPSCAFVFIERTPLYQALSHEYAWEKTSADERDRRGRSLLGKLDQHTRWRLAFGKYLEERRLLATIGRTGKVLDVGCGSTVRLPTGDLVPYGIEISEYLATAADPLFRARGGHVVHGPALDGMVEFPDDFFSAVLMRSYLEHETEARKVLELTNRKLRPGGVVLVKVPNFDSLSRKVMGISWCGFRFPDHVNYFTDTTLRALAEATGFTYQCKNRLISFDDNIYSVLRKPIAVP